MSSLIRQSTMKGKHHVKPTDRRTFTGLESSEVKSEIDQMRSPEKIFQFA